MKVRQVMTKRVITTRPEVSFREAVGLMIAADVSGIPVVDHDHRLLGIVTEADLISKEAAVPSTPRRRLLGLLADAFAGERSAWVGKAVGTNVEQVMTIDIVTVSPDDDVRTAARRMLEHRVKRLPVVDEDNRIVGIVSRQDVLRIFRRSDAELRFAVEEMLERSLFMRPDYDVSVDVTDGLVTIEGTVLYRGDVGMMQAIVQGIEGVVDVVTRLVSREPEPAGADRIDWPA